MSSIHLETLLDLTKIPIDKDLSIKMDAVRRICNAALFLRKEVGIRVRMPLNEMIVYSKNNLDIENFANIIKSEINVKNILFDKNFEKVASEKLIVNLKKCGQRFGKQIPDLVKAVNSGNWAKIENGVKVLDFILSTDEYEIKLDIKDKNVKACSCGNIVIFLNTIVTPELEYEGIARDITRMIQQNRKDMNLNVSDRIKITIISENEKIKYIIQNKELLKYIENETLSDITNDDISDIGTLFNHTHDEVGDIGLILNLKN